MLDNVTKRRIDTARDILVGKVPDPKSQVEQITIALIYKFMDDMDAQAEEMGGKRSFFAGEYEKYGWAKLMSLGKGGHEVLNLYGEAITTMNQNEGIPPLFRDIFKNAYLPYRDPETLKSFLKIINDFEYDHSERLGDAFEYLLSVLGSQGDAGQFRTPRHIIDFMVEVIDPKKDESILDPACGTAGFLISSWKHVLQANSKGGRKGAGLTPDERNRLTENIKGYDISPDMVRLSLVNLYLHGFTDPHISEYDTLTSEDNWNEYSDIIMANPPFMSPKGGIKPHKRFSVQAKRSEVLFVDYIAEHLTPNGRAAVIVPEGIIFQSQNAYKQLRKMLVENYLYAVLSLPAGVFQPYSGVKTSILLIDKTLAKKCDSILFVKIENDGFDLGAQRRQKEGTELPEAVKIIKDYVQAITAGRHSRENGNPDWTPGQAGGDTMHLVVPKEKIGENGEWNLSGERYRENDELRNSSYELVELGNHDFFRIESGGTPKSKEESYWNGGIHWATLIDLPQDDFITNITDTVRNISENGLNNSSAKLLPEGTVIVSTRATIGRVGIARTPLATNQGFKNIIIKDRSQVIPEYIAYMMKQLVPKMEAMATGGTFKEISKSTVALLKIPLPPLKIQQEIVAEIEGYQKIIDGARAVVENYKPQIQIDPKWEMVKLGDVTDRITKGTTPTTNGFKFEETGINFIKIETIDNSGYFINHKFSYISQKCHKSLKRSQIISGDVLFSIAGALGRVALVQENVLPANTNQALSIISPKKALNSKYLKQVLMSDLIQSQIYGLKVGVAQSNLSLTQVSNFEIPLPNLETQTKIVAQIEKEQALVNANKELITLFEQKIKDKIASVWGE